MNAPQIVVTDGYTLNPGDNPWDALEALGQLTVYDRTSNEELIDRSRMADILIVNKTLAARRRLMSQTVANIEAFACGRPLNVVNAQFLKTA